MKLRLLTVLALVVTAVAARAQALTYTGPDTVYYNAALNTIDDLEEINGYIVNNTNTAGTIVWYVSNLSKADDWAFTLCDINNCYIYDIPNTGYNTFTAQPGTQYLWKYGISPYCAAGTGIMEVTAWLQGDSINTAAKFYFVATYTGACTTGITDEENQTGARIYPTHFTNNLWVETNTYANQTVSLYNATGVLVSRQQFTGNKTMLSVADLPTGMYVAEVAGPNGRSTQRVVKNQ